MKDGNGNSTEQPVRFDAETEAYLAPKAEAIRENWRVVSDRLAKVRPLYRQMCQDIWEAHEWVKANKVSGGFRRWVERDLPADLTRGHAYKMKDAYEVFKDEDAATLDNLYPTAMLDLAAGTTSEPVREEAVERAKSGERITPKKVKEMKARRAGQDGKKGQSRPKKSKDVPDYCYDGHRLAVVTVRRKRGPKPLTSAQIIDALRDALRHAELGDVEEEVVWPEELRKGGAAYTAVDDLPGVVGVSEGEIEEFAVMPGDGLPGVVGVSEGAPGVPDEDGEEPA